MNHAKAAKTLYDLNPFTSLAIPHAAIAGVCLFLSGLLAGYFDNMAVYRKVGPRLKAHARLANLMGQERLNKFSEYMERNLGALGVTLFSGSCSAVWAPLVLFSVCRWIFVILLCFGQLYSRTNKY